MNFLKKTEVRFFEALNATYKFLYDNYSRNKETLTPASPSMQIITVMHSISQNIFSYIEDSLLEFNIIKARKVQSIHGLARLVGHNATRAIASTGEIKFKIKTEKISEIKGSVIYIPNKTVLKCKENKKTYTLLLNKDRLLIDKDNINYIYSVIIQGEFKEQTFVSNGLQLQSFNVQPKRKNLIDNSNIIVTVNGFNYDIIDSLLDINYKEKACVLKTGINGGIDLYFGNNNHGEIPAEGALIKVEYLETDGLSGNIYNNLEGISFNWEEVFYDNLGEEVDPNDFFNTELNSKIIFGANPENPLFTKLIAPHVSRTNVLGTADNYIYYFQKMNIFSYVNAYTTFDDDYLLDDNTIYLYLIPDIKRKLEEDNYFKINTDDFILDDEEKNKLLELVQKSKRQTPSTELKIITPTMKKYVINVALDVFENYDEVTLKNNIITILSNYMLNVKRKDKIPRSDLIKKIEEIENVDSVFVEFVSEENETALAKGYYYKNTVTETGTNKIKINLSENEDPNLGLNEFKDITTNQNELAVIRGGWFDVNNTFYEEYYEGLDKLGPINIFIKNVIKEDLQSKILKNSLNK